MALSPGERRRRSPAPAATPLAAVVVRSDPTGVYAAPLRGDRTALGPLLGATEDQVLPQPGGQHTHTARRLPVGRAVLLQLTAVGVWVLAHDPTLDPTAADLGGDPA